MRVLLLTCGLVVLCAIFLLYTSAPAAQAYPLPGTASAPNGTDSTTTNNTGTTTNLLNNFDFRNSWNQLTEPFQNFINNIQNAQSNNPMTSPTNITVQIPQQTFSIDLGAITTWISSTANAIVRTAINWILAVAHR